MLGTDFLLFLKLNFWWIFLAFPTRDFRTVDPEEVVGAPEDPVPIAQLSPAGDLATIDTGPAKRDKVKDPLVSG